MDQQALACFTVILTSMATLKAVRTLLDRLVDCALKRGDRV